jgi:GT2 family glycosyltransferase
LVSVIIPVRNGAGTLAACLDAVAAQQDAPAFEVIVVDNTSVDGSRALAAAHGAVTIVVDEARVSSYAARDAGIEAATGEVLAFTDADCVPEPRWLAEGLAALSRAGAGLAGGDVVPIVDTRPNAWERYDRAVYLRQGEAVEHDHYAATANLFVQRSVIDSVGSFDASLLSGGDYEFCRRAVAAGFDLVHVPDARVGHRSRDSLAATWRVHRRLGAGWAVLSRRGVRPPAGRDPALRLALGTVVDRATAIGDPVRRREIAHVHAVAMAARWTGRLTGRA